MVKMWLIQRIRWATLVTRIGEDLRKRLYNEAFRNTERLYELQNIEIPSPRASPFQNILYATAAEHVDKLGAFSAAKCALAQLSTTKQKYNEDEVNFFKYICKLIFLRITKFSDSEAFLLAIEIDIDFNDLKLDNVRGRFRRTFPLDSANCQSWDRYAEDNGARV